MIAPRLSALKDRLGAQGLSVVGITTDEAEQAAVFAERHQMRYPVVDQDGETSRAYGITGFPTMILIDKQGVVRDVFIGFDPTGDARLEAAVPQAPRRAGAVGHSGDPNAERAASRRSLARARRLFVGGLGAGPQSPPVGTPTSWIFSLEPLAHPDVVLRVDDHRAGAVDRLDQLHSLLGPEDEHRVVDRVGGERVGAQMVTLRDAVAG